MNESEAMALLDDVFFSVGLIAIWCGFLIATPMSVPLVVCLTGLACCVMAL